MSWSVLPWLSIDRLVISECLNTYANRQTLCVLECITLDTNQQNLNLGLLDNGHESIDYLITHKCNTSFKSTTLQRKISLNKLIEHTFTYKPK